MKVDKFIKYLDESQDHNFTGSTKTPLRRDAFDMSDDEKISLIKKNVAEILQTLGMDLSDDSLKGTPNRVSKNVCERIVCWVKSKK